MVASGLNFTKVPCLKSLEPVLRLSKEINSPFSKTTVSVIPSRADTAVKRSDKAFVAFAPIPFSPPEVLYPELPSLSYFPPVLVLPKIFCKIGFASSFFP